MRFKDIKLAELYIDRDGYGDYLAYCDDLHDWLNDKRKSYGYTDLVTLECDNDVYYDFYLMFDAEKHKIELQGKCNYGEMDDEVWYKVDLTREEEEMLIWKLINKLTIEITKRDDN